MANPEDPNAHVHAGNLLLLTGSIEDAVKAFSNANDLKKTYDSICGRAKAYLLLG